MSASEEGNIIADVMSKKPNVTITRFPAIIRVDGVGKLEFDMEEIGDALGKDPGEYTVSMISRLRHRPTMGGRFGSTIRYSSSQILKTLRNTLASTQ